MSAFPKPTQDDVKRMGKTSVRMLAHLSYRYIQDKSDDFAEIGFDAAGLFFEMMNKHHPEIYRVNGIAVSRIPEMMRRYAEDQQDKAARKSFRTGMAWLSVISENMLEGMTVKDITTADLVNWIGDSWEIKLSQRHKVDYSRDDY